MNVFKNQEINLEVKLQGAIDLETTRKRVVPCSTKAEIPLQHSRKDRNWENSQGVQE